MRSRALARLVGGAMLACGLLWSAVAQGQTTTNYVFSVTCTSAGQLCSPPFTVNVTTTGLLQVQYIASPTHCSNVRAHILVDGTELAVTAFLTPGQSSGFFNLGPVSSGAHVVALQGEGQIGGCNSGSLGGWGGTAQVTVDAAPVPAPGIIATALFFLLGAFAFWYRRGSR